MRYTKKEFFRFTLLIVVIAIVNQNNLWAHQRAHRNTIQPDKKKYLVTSVFILSSFIPNDDTYFFELDYGYKLRSNIDLIFGLNTYKYAAPMSIPIKDNTKYPGTVKSYGFVTAFQYYFWKNIFVDQMINPLILDYNHSGKTISKNGFMLLLATRLGYHYDFKLFNNPFFVEIGAEVSYWPVNTNLPADYKSIDDLNNDFVFSPAFQFGFKF